MDALAEMLHGMRLSGAVFLDAEFSEPWCIGAQVAAEDCRPFMPMPAQLIAYHYVLEGRLHIGVDGAASLTAEAGQLLVLPRNSAHRLGSQTDLPPTDPGPLIEPAGADGLARLRLGGGGARTRVLCGFLGSDGHNDALLASLPAVMRLDLRERLAGSWIEGSMRYAARELASGTEGASTCLARLAELLFAEAIREYLKTRPPQLDGWLAGLRDPFVARALTLIHRRPEQPWTLETLAQQVGLSRSAFSERFVRHLQVSPIRYVARQRLQRSADCLSHGGLSIARIAEQAGYESEASFTRAFKREFGTAPGAYRRSHGVQRPE